MDAEDPSSHRLALLTVSLVGIVCATVVFSLAVFLSKRNANFNEKLRALVGSYVDTEASKDYGVSLQATATRSEFRVRAKRIRR